MAGIAVTEETFEREVLASEQPAIVDFWAPWCAPCLAVAPVLEGIAWEHVGEVKLVNVDIDEEPGLAIRYGISSIPTIVRFEGGAPVAVAVGFRGKRHLEEDLGLAPREAWSSAPESGRLRRLLSRLGGRSQ